MFDGLDRVAWAGLQHAYGDGAEVPGQLRAVASAKRVVANRARSRLEQILEHQGTVYPATAAAVPFLRGLLLAAGPDSRVRLLGLLRRIADGAGFLHQHAGVPFVVAGSPEELEVEQAYVAAARAAVVDGMPVYLSALSDPDRGIRVHLRAAAAVGLRWQRDRIRQPAEVLPVLARSLGMKLPVLAKAPWVEDEPYDLIAEAMGVDLAENLPFLRQALTSRTWTVRDASVSRASTLMATWRHTPPILVPELVPLLADRTPTVRARAVSVVVGNGWPALDAALDALAEALADAGSRVDLDQVQRRPQPNVRDPDAQVLVTVLTALAERGDARVLDGVRRLLRSNALALPWGPALAGMALHADVLLPDVVYALETADLDAPPVFSRLIRLAKGLAAVDILVDLLPGMPIFALNELAELGPAAVSAVAQVRAALISSEDDGDRFAAAHAWWRITTDPQYLLTPLMATLHPNKIRPRHAEILGEIGQPAGASLPFLREVRDRLRRYRIGGFNTTVRQDEELRAAATHAITRITHETT